MALKIIFGRAGSGKTYYCLEQIRSALRQSPLGSPLIMLVPEQATFQIEQSLAATPDLRGFFRTHVLSFQRLAYHVSLEIGGAAKPHISELGRQMALRKILAAKKKDLSVLHKAAERKGFTQKLAVTMAEFKMYRIAPWDLAGSAEYFAAIAQHVPLQDKLQDLAILYQAWEEFLSDRYQDLEDCLTLLGEQIPQSAFIKYASIWIDGFHGFTPQEYYVIEQIMRAIDVNITLCLDPVGKELAAQETSVFHAVWKTWQRLMNIAEENGVTVDYIEHLGECLPRFVHAPGIRHLESQFFAYPNKAFTGDLQQQIELICAANPRAEIEGVARKIRELCYSLGLRYRDIVILLRDMVMYSELIETIFADYEIPVFVDQKGGILHHPLTELIRSTLEIIIGNWGYDAVFRYLKTDLTDLTRDDIDILENYVLAHGIRGKRWIDGHLWEYIFRYTLDEETSISNEEKSLLVRLNEIRNAVIGPLVIFNQAIKDQPTVSSITTALVNFLISLKVPEKLEHWSREAQQIGALTQAKQHQQIWNNIVDLFDQMVETLGDQTIAVDEYLHILESGLETIELGLIPPGIDQVLVASVDRSRSPNVRAAFVLGVNDGMYPARIADDDLFSFADREKLKIAGLELAPGRNDRMIEEQFFLYTALTRASQYLWLSYIQADDEGKGVAPSYVIRQLKDLFPALVEVNVHVEPDGGNDLQYITHPRRTLTHLSGKLREAIAGNRIDMIWWSVYKWAAEDERNRQRLEKIITGLQHKNQDPPVGRALTQALYGKLLRISVSKIESFRKCPFAYFVAFALKLKKRPIFRLEAPNLGQFYHAVLKMAGEQLFQNGRTWGDLSREECINLVNDMVDTIVPRLQSEILQSSARYKYLVGKIRKVITRSALTLAEHDRRGCFRPMELELSFGSQGKLPPIVLHLENGQIIEVEGRIDRIDAAKTDKGIYLRIIDYKMGDERLTLSDVFYGLRLQLITYLYASLSFISHNAEEAIKPGGMLYFRIQDPIISCEPPMEATDLEREIIKAMKMRGFILADPNVAYLMDRKIGTDGYRASDLVPVSMLKDGTFDNKSAVLDERQIEVLLRHAEALLQESGQCILQGVVDIKPYKMNGKTACTYCQYSSVCQFDELLEDNAYNHLHKRSPTFIWKTLCHTEQGVDR